MTRAILHVDMDQFYAAVEIRDNPALKGRPLIIGSDPQQGKGRGVVSTASYEARAYGVRSAMPISRAWKLCPQGTYLRGDMDKYAEVSEKIFEAFESFTPAVEGLSLDEAFLDVTGSRLLFGGPEECARQVKRKVFEAVRLNCSVGAASCKSVAKIASDLRKPDALVVVEPGREAEFLAPLPAGRLWGVGPKMQEELAGLGLKTAGEIAAYPFALLQSRFGDFAFHLHDMALGRDDREVVPDHEAKSLGRECTFEEDCRDLDHLDATLAGLCEEVSRRLRRHGFRAGQLSLKLRWEGFETHTRQRPLGPPTAHGPELLTAAREMLAHFLGKDGRRVRLIGVAAGHLLRQGESFQEGLFERNPQKKEQADSALDRINERFGEGAITHLSAVDRERRRP